MPQKLQWCVKLISVQWNRSTESSSTGHAGLMQSASAEEPVENNPSPWQAFGFLGRGWGRRASRRPSVEGLVVVSCGPGGSSRHATACPRCASSPVGRSGLEGLRPHPLSSRCSSLAAVLALRRSHPPTGSTSFATPAEGKEGVRSPLCRRTHGPPGQGLPRLIVPFGASAAHLQYRSLSAAPSAEAGLEGRTP